MKFQGSDKYVATQDLMLAVNAPLPAAPAAGQGRARHRQDHAGRGSGPGAGHALLQWHIKSTTKAQQGLYEYDAVSRLRDSQLGDERVKDIRNYIVKGVLWQAFTAESPWCC
jgi:hypothetical protein